MKASHNGVKLLHSICGSKELQSLVRNSTPYNIEYMVQLQIVFVFVFLDQKMQLQKVITKKGRTILRLIMTTKYLDWDARMAYEVPQSLEYEKLKTY